MWFRRRNSESNEESKKALIAARRSLREVRQLSDEVTSISNALKEIRERNHFAEQLEEIILRRRGMIK